MIFVEDFLLMIYYEEKMKDYGKIYSAEIARKAENFTKVWDKYFHEKITKLILMKGELEKLLDLPDFKEFSKMEF